jgi:hypothetical protein
MASISDIEDATFRAALQEAERQLDDGEYTGAARICAETYLALLSEHPELIPPPDIPDTQPPNPEGRPLVAEGQSGLAQIDAARAARRNWWPGTGAISVTVDADRRPAIVYARDRVSLSEASGYFEFLLEQLAALQRQ